MPLAARNIPGLLCGAAAVVAAGFIAPALSVQAPDVSGEEIFAERCASCHGVDGTGDGPMAQALKVPPADLTTISRRSGGAFPGAEVVRVITFGAKIPAHGTSEMPVWGKIFSDEGGRGKIGAANSRRSIVELKRFLETIQKK